MDVDLRSASILKTKIYIKWHKLFFLLTGKNTTYEDGLLFEQTFKSTFFIANRTVNKDVKKIIRNSVYFKLDNVITGTAFFSKPQKEVKFFIKDSLINKFDSSFFVILVIKLNRKFYYPDILKKMNFLNYIENKLFFFSLSVMQKRVLLHKIQY